MRIGDNLIMATTKKDEAEKGSLWDFGSDWDEAIAESDANPYRGCDAAFAGDDAESDTEYDELVSQTISKIRS